MKESGQEGIDSTVDVAVQRVVLLLVAVWLLPGHPCCQIVLCPIVETVCNVLAGSFILEEGPYHVYLPWGVRRLSHDAVCEVDAFLVSICEYDRVVTV